MNADSSRSPMTVMIDVSSITSVVEGIGRYAQRLIEAMLKGGQNLRILAITRHPDLLRTHFSESSKMSIVLCDPEKDGDRNAVFERARREGVSVYHGPSFSLPPSLPVPGVVTIHDLAFLRDPRWYPPGFAAHLSLVTKDAVERSAQVITVSDHVGAELIRRYPDARGKVNRVYEAPGLDNGEGEAPLPDGLSRDGYILAVGARQRRKNAAGLVGAYAELRARRSLSDKLVLVGGLSSEDPALPRIIRESGVADSIVCLDRVEDDVLDALYQSAKLFVHCSFDEGFGLPPLEAMARGIPTIASDGGALPEVLADGACVVPSGHTPSLVRVLDRLLKDADERRDLGLRGRQRAETFSWERAAQETVAVYRKAAGQGKALTVTQSSSAASDAVVLGSPRIAVDARFSSYPNTGTGRYTREILQALLSSQHGAEIVLIGPESVEESLLPDTKAILQHIPAGEETLLNPAWEQFSLPSLLSGCDLLFSPTGVLPIARPCKGVAVIHGISFVDRPDDFPSSLRSYLQRWVRTTCMSADLLIAVSEFTKQTIERSFDVPSRPIRVVHHGRPENDVWCSQASGPASPTARPYLLFVGSLEPNKDVPHLLEAFGDISASWPGDLVLAVRPGRDLEAIRARASELRLSERVRLVLNPGDEELVRLYRGASLFASSASYEPFGLSLVEAMGFGLPIVARALTGTPEVVGDGGLLVDDPTPRAFGRAVLRVLTDPRVRQDLADAARKRATNFSWKKAASETWAALHECLGAS